MKKDWRKNKRDRQTTVELNKRRVVFHDTLQINAKLQQELEELRTDHEQRGLCIEALLERLG
jgi:hypothetical protein